MKEKTSFLILNQEAYFTYKFRKFTTPCKPAAIFRYHFQWENTFGNQQQMSFLTNIP